MEKNKSKQELYLNDDDSIMKTHSKVKFIISGFPMSPNELTKIIGINPTSISEKGKFTEKYKQVIKENSWSINSELGTDVDIQTQTDFLLEKIRPQKPKLLEICRSYPPLLNCTVRIYGGDRPPLDLSKENIRELSEYNAEFGIDIYIFEEE
jgi:DNA-binding XRE family transcriptional regulator